MFILWHFQSMNLSVEQNPQTISLYKIQHLHMQYIQNSMNVGPCHHGMARPQVADGGTASSMEVAVNKLNKQPRTAD
jgi:hypothetical protein